MQAIGCLLMGIMVLVLVAVSIVLLILQGFLSFFGIRLPLQEWIIKQFARYTRFRPNSSQQQSAPSSASRPAQERKKLYTEEEGEYVDFEEVKE